MGKTNIMASLIGSAIVGILGLIFALWLPFRILAVWRGEKSAPPVPIRKKDKYFLGYHIFDVNERNFPVFGTSLFCMAVFALFMGISGALESMGGSGGIQLFKGIVFVMLGLAFLFGLIAQVIFTFGRPKSLIPPSHREKAN
jgi:hypothetical protein